MTLQTYNGPKTIATSLQDQVAWTLSRDAISLKCKHLEVEEIDGQIMISGKVDRYFDKQLVQKIAMDVPGVTQLDNQLVVR